ncbi:MAG: hypothetical protein WBI82_16265 [Sphaerochaeta sp.]
MKRITSLGKTQTDGILWVLLEYLQICEYQDGLPICDKEKDIVADIAKTGSPNSLPSERKGVRSHDQLYL